MRPITFPIDVKSHFAEIERLREGYENGECPAAPLYALYQLQAAALLFSVSIPPPAWITYALEQQYGARSPLSRQRDNENPQANERLNRLVGIQERNKKSADSSQMARRRGGAVVKGKARDEGDELIREVEAVRSQYRTLTAAVRHVCGQRTLRTDVWRFLRATSRRNFYPAAKVVCMRVRDIRVASAAADACSPTPARHTSIAERLSAATRSRYAWRPRTPR
jgi:hypothetical protein